MNPIVKLENIFSQKNFGDYKWIDPKNIIVANWVRMKCTYGCSDYGRASCPPNTPSIEECKNFFSEYSKAVVFHFNFDAEKGKYPVAYSNKLDAQLIELEKEVFLNGYFKAFALTQNCCILCKDCASTRSECKFPEKSRPSPEAFGVNVYETVRNLGFEINVVTQPHQSIDRYAFLLVE